MSTEIVSCAEKIDSNMTDAKPTQEKPEVLEEQAKELFVKGKRHLVCEQFSDAVDCFGQCCSLFSQRFGEKAMECVDPYLGYANSLLQLDRSQTKLTKTADNIDEENGTIDEEDEEEEGQVEENGEAGETKEKVENKKEETDEQEELPKGTVETVAGEDVELEKTVVPDDPNVPANSGADDKDKLENGEETDEENVDDGLGLAWTMADLARLILEELISTNSTDDGIRIRLANCRLLLGEIQVANELYAEAIEEFKCCLDIYVDTLHADDRRIAEVYFQIGSAFNMDDKYDSAAEYFRKAISVLETKKTNLETSINADATNGASSVLIDSEGCKQEIEDIASLIIDLNQRLSDMVESQKQMEDCKESLQEITSKRVLADDDDCQIVDKTEEETKKTKFENGNYRQDEQTAFGDVIVANGRHVTEEKTNELSPDPEENVVA